MDWGFLHNKMTPELRRHTFHSLFFYIFCKMTLEFLSSHIVLDEIQKSFIHIAELFIASPVKADINPERRCKLSADKNGFLIGNKIWQHGDTKSIAYQLFNGF